MGKLAEAWGEYEARCLPANCSHVQRVETRRAFYGGASTMFHAMVTGVSSNPDEYTPEDEALMDGLKAECDQFLADVMARKA